MEFYTAVINQLNYFLCGNLFRDRLPQKILTEACCVFSMQCF